MLRNYFNLAWRNIQRNKANSIINISGLAIGLASAIFIFLYVQDELQYDRFLKDANQIYQVNLEGNFGGEEFLAGTTPPPAGVALKNAFPEVETYARIYRPGDAMVSYEGNSQNDYFTERNILGVDSNFLQLFSYGMLAGNPSTALLQPNAVVITEQASKKYFGTEDAMGKTLLFGLDKKPFIVSGILHDLPAQSSLQFDMLRPIASYPVVKKFSWSWVWLQVSTYVKLRVEVANEKSVQALEAKFPAMVQQQAASAFKRIGQPLDELKKKGGKWDLHLQPLTSVHLHSANVGTRLTTLGDIKYVRIFSLIALFIIVLACVNFMNLSTAQSAKRAREVGIRKVLGSLKKQLIRQFFGEAILFVLIAAALALLVVISCLRPFNELSGKQLSAGLLAAGNFLFYFLGLIVVTSLLAASYPAFYLSSFKPVSVLKGKLDRTSLGNLFIRNGMVIFQFTISTGLIICTMIVFQQLRFTRKTDLGLDKDNTIVIANSNRLLHSEEAFREEISQLPEVAGATISSSVPTKGWFGDGYEPEPTGNDQLVKDLMIASFIADDNFIPTLRLKLLKGRNFSRAFNDSASVILNETAAREIGWKDPVGKHMQYPGNNNQRFQVIGIVKNFNFESLRDTILPFALFYSSSKTYNIGTSYVLARIKTSEMNKVVDKLKATWTTFAPNIPFDYSFLDEEFDALYKSDRRMGEVFGLFTLLSIFVACLGLFGLATYTAERRIREIGVRKVLGASVEGLAVLLSKDFIKLVLIAALIAFPLAWWSMNKWLEAFAYRIRIEWWVFVVAVSVALLIALITVSFQAIRAAMMNPVKSLRME